MSKLNLAVQLKQAVANVAKLDTHPLAGADAHDKLNYLKGLSLVIHADKNKHAEEAAYFGALFRTLNPGQGTLDELLAFAEKPDFTDMTAIRQLLRRQEITGMAFLLDLVMLAAADAAISEEEKALIAACREFVGWGHTIFNRWYTYCAILAIGENNAVFENCLRAFPTTLTDHLLQHRGFVRSSGGANTWDREALRNDLPPDWVVPQLETSLALAPADSMAAQVKTALAAVATLGSHPLKEANLEDKLNYLKALCLAMAADGTIAGEESVYFGAVARTLIADNLIQGLRDFTANPDLSEVANMIEVFKKSDDYKKALLLDAAMLVHADGHYHQDEQDLVVQLRDLLGWDRDRFNGVRALAEAVAKTSEGPVLDDLCRDQMSALCRHLVEYRGLALAAPPSAASLGFTFKNHYRSYDYVVNGSQVSETPVSLRQFFPFLQYLEAQGRLTGKNDVLCLDTGEELVALSENGLELINDRLVSAPEINDEPILHISPLAASLYCAWLSRGDERRYELPRVEDDSTGYISHFIGPNFLFRHGSKGRVYKYEETKGSYMKIGKDAHAVPDKICREATLYVVPTEGKNDEPIASPLHSSCFYVFMSI
jgi:tellurite resistance protein